MNTSQETIGFVGVGLMGHGMAASIMKGGYPLHIIAHRNREPVDDLVSNGAVEAATLEELATACTIIHICAPGSPQVEQIVANIAPHMAAGGIIIDCSTSDPTSTEKLSTQLAGQGITLVDAPLGGTPVQAEAGELQGMIGAPDETFQRIKPVIDCWAATVIHLGPTGDGHKMKLLNNFISLGYGAMYAEALALGNKVGITPEKFDSVIRGSRMDCGFYQTFMGYLMEGNRESHKFTLTNAHKDLRYAEAMANNAGMPNPIGTAAKSHYARALAMGGDGPEDYIPHMVDFVGRASGTDLVAGIPHNKKKTDT